MDQEEQEVETVGGEGNDGDNSGVDQQKHEAETGRVEGDNRVVKELVQLSLLYIMVILAYFHFYMKRYLRGKMKRLYNFFLFSLEPEEHFCKWY